jgi:DcuC family C4-dicarboxylate transporter
MSLASLAAIVVVVVAIVLIVRGWDVRLALLAASLVIAGITGLMVPSDPLKPLASVVREFLGTFSNEKFVVPICSAMGFAYVLRYTGCERHLVLVLVKPLRSVRWLLVPGVIVVGFLVNIPVISQTSTAVCIGPVIVPLMRAAGYSFATIGACLLLGTSVGGELLNPGAPELLTVFNKTGISTQRQVSEYLPKLVFTQLAVAVLVAWVMSLWWERTSEQTALEADGTIPAPPVAGTEDLPTSERINILKAIVPLVPLVLLFCAGPPLDWLHVPQHWVVARPPEAAVGAVVGSPVAYFAEKKLEPSYSSRLIGLAMLVGVVVAMATTPGKARGCVRQFFDGAGYGFANIVSLIVTATCFGKAIETAGLAAALGRLIAETPGLLHPLAALVPLGFAAVSGSGMASTQSLYGFFYDPAMSGGQDPTAVGAMVGVGSAAGRTMSPVSAVTLMCATLTQTCPFTLAKRVAVPLFAGVGAVIVLRLCGVV